MRRKLIIILTAFSFVSNASNAFAIMNIPAKVQTVIEKAKKEGEKVQEYIKKVDEAKNAVAQGVDFAKSCLDNPTKCDVDALEKIKNNTIEGFNDITTKKGDIVAEDPEKLAENVKDTEYKSGSKDAIQAVHENHQKNNAVTTDDVAILYAKGAVNQQSIINENDNGIYPKQSTLDSINKIIIAQDNVEMLSVWRLSRILEMRAYMNSARGVAELTQHIQHPDGEEE